MAKSVDLDSLVGMDENAALAVIKKNGLRSRITARDGQAFMGTCDYCTDRVNLRVNRGKVTEAKIG